MTLANLENGYVTDSIQETGAAAADQDGYKPYDHRNLSYAGTFTNPFKANTIRSIEWMTGKFKLIRLIRQYEKMGVRPGQPFWEDCLKVMGIDLTTPQEQIEKIPSEGPLVITANHPHGLVDGMVLAELVGRRRTDYKILTRSLLTNVPEISQFMIPVAFPHEANAQRLNIEMRKTCMAHLNSGGAIILFPAGSVAYSETYFGPAIESPWNPFTAKMILKSGAAVQPIKFTGQNSRAYQIANKLSATVRQGLLLHEVAVALNKPQAPIVGDTISTEDVNEWSANPRGLMEWLRETTMGLG